ncbi:hypothetical protein F8C62_05180, partial [Salmonella enterica]|nr:hypothetical protein [Salmonella enterica]
MLSLFKYKRVIMPVTLSFGNRHGYEVNHSRLV